MSGLKYVRLLQLGLGLDVRCLRAPAQQMTHGPKTQRKLGFTSCECPVGQRHGTSGDSCENCGTGRYGDTTGAASCKLCPAGKYNGVEGSTVASACTDCAAHTYAASEGTVSCTSCDTTNGYFSTTGGSGGVGSTGCIQSKCEIGKYGDLSGGSGCTNCPAGKYGDIIGLSTDSQCKDCAVGKHNPSTGKTAASDCIDCVIGKYSSSSSAQTCTLCRESKEHFFR